MNIIINLFFFIFFFIVLFIVVSRTYLHLKYISNPSHNSFNTNNYNRIRLPPEQQYLPYQPDPAYDYDYENDSSVMYQPSTTPTRTAPPSTTQPRTAPPSTTQPRATPPSTTPPSTTPPSTTPPSTTQPRATPPSTTQPRTAPPSTTQPRATPPSTTQQRATPPSTTPPSTTPPSTTQQSTTPPSTTQQLTTTPSTNLRTNYSTYLRIQDSNPETINVSYPTTKPYGYGSIRGWYGSSQSTYLLNHPIKAEYEQMNRNYVTNNEPWKFLHLPTKAELPNYGSWWDWDVELQKINNVIDYLGETLGKFETHFIAATEIVDTLKWVPKTNLGQEQRFEITNVSLRNALASKISATNPNATITFTQQEWNAFNITTTIRTPHYIKIGNSQYKPFSPGTNRVNNEALAIISRDWEIGARPEEITPKLTLRVEECGGVCLMYKTKNNRQRIYMAIDLGMGHYEVLNGSNFMNNSNNYKKQWLRDEIYASISHEYSHVIQRQIIDPILPVRWSGEESSFGERSPNAISRWWIESFATLLPYFMGFSFEGFNVEGKIIQSITEIRNNTPTTSQEFADRMMYVQPYGYLTKHHWSFLAAAYMAKLTSWKYVLVDFYYDFQRVPSNSRVTGSNNNNNNIYYVPDLDKLFLHNFDKTEENFLKDLYTLIKTNPTIDINYFLPNQGATLLTTANVLPAGTSRYNVEGFGNYNENNSNKVCNFM